MGRLSGPCVLPIFPSGLARRIRRGEDHDIPPLFTSRRSRHSRGKFLRNGARDLEVGFIGADADCPNFIPGDVSPAAQERQNPARIGILPAANVHAEPDDILKAAAVALLVISLAGIGGGGQKFFRLGQRLAVRADKSRRNIFRRPFGQQLLCDGSIFIIKVSGLEQRLQQPLPVTLADVLRARRLDPRRIDPRATQHPVNPAATVIRHDEDCCTLFPGTARSARSML